MLQIQIGQLATQSLHAKATGPSGTDWAASLKDRKAAKALVLAYQQNLHRCPVALCKIVQGM